MRCSGFNLLVALVIAFVALAARPFDAGVVVGAAAAVPQLADRPFVPSSTALVPVRPGVCRPVAVGDSTYNKNPEKEMGGTWGMTALGGGGGWKMLQARLPHTLGGWMSLLDDIGSTAHVKSRVPEWKTLRGRMPRTLEGWRSALLMGAQRPVESTALVVYTANRKESPKWVVWANGVAVYILEGRRLLLSGARRPGVSTTLVVYMANCQEAPAWVACLEGAMQSAPVLLEAAIRRAKECVASACVGMLTFLLFLAVQLAVPRLRTRVAGLTAPMCGISEVSTGPGDNAETTVDCENDGSLDAAAPVDLEALRNLGKPVPFKLPVASVEATKGRKSLAPVPAVAKSVVREAPENLGKPMPFKLPVASAETTKSHKAQAPAPAVAGQDLRKPVPFKLPAASTKAAKGRKAQAPAPAAEAPVDLDAIKNLGKPVPFKLPVAATMANKGRKAQAPAAAEPVQNLGKPVPFKLSAASAGATKGRKAQAPVPAVAETIQNLGKPTPFKLPAASAKAAKKPVSAYQQAEQKTKRCV